MHPINSSKVGALDTLNEIVSYCDQVIAANSASRSDGMTEEQLVHASFRDANKSVLVQVAEQGEAVRVLNAEIAGLRAQNLLHRVLNWTRLSALEARRDETAAFFCKLKNVLEDARIEHARSAGVRQSILISIQKSAERTARRSEAGRIRDTATELLNTLIRYENLHGDVVELLQITAPPRYLDAGWTIASANTWTSQLAVQTTRELPHFIGLKAAATEARNILNELLENTQAQSVERPPRFVANTVASLKELTNADGADSLDEILILSTDPRQFKKVVPWLLFWNCVGATSGYARTSVGTRATEDPRTGWWCESWRAQMGSWSKDALRAIGVTRDTLQCGILQLQNSIGETRSGSDVLMMLLVSLPEGEYCRLASIQFKRNENDGPSISLDQGNWRQYDTMTSLQELSAGRVHGLHALLRNVAAGLATIPAITLDVSRPSVVRSRQSDSYTRGRTDGSGKSIRWVEEGESLATVLAHALGPNEAGFESAAAAFDWLDEQTGVELPSYLVIQGVGARAQSLTHALTRGLKLATSRGRRYVALERLHGRSQTLKPDQSPGMSR